MRQVAGYRGVHRGLGVFELCLVKQFGILRLFLIRAREKELLVAVLLHHVYEVGEVLVAEENLAFTVLDVVLEVECNGLCRAEILHRVGYQLAQFLGHAEEMVNGVLAIEDNGGVLGEMDTGFAELGGREADHFEEFIKGKVEAVFAD